MEQHVRDRRDHGLQAGRHPRVTWWLGGLVALAGLVALVVAGCSGPASSPQRSPSQGLQGGASSGRISGAGGIVSPPPGSSSGRHAGSKAGSKAGSNGGSTLSFTQRSGVVGGALFGGDVPLTPEQSRLGRSLAIVRIYDYVGENFYNPKVRRIMSAGSTLLVSLVTKPGGPSYASIAAGHYDGIISTFLRSMEQAAVHYHLGAMYICFEVEADAQSTHFGLGTPSQFVQAWDHVHQLAVSQHLDWNQGGRLHWVFILTHRAYISGVASEYWVGANETDIISADGYNAQGCRGIAGSRQFVALGSVAETPTDLFGALLRFARSHGALPVFIAEWGTVPYSSPTVVPGWIRQMQDFVTSNHDIAAAMYWNSHAPGTACDYSLNNYPSALSALATMGHSAGLNGHIVPAN